MHRAHHFPRRCAASCAEASGRRACSLGDDYSVPICAQLVGGLPRQLGSGFFFQCAAEWFLVTASHVAVDLYPKGALASGGTNDCDLLVPGVDDRLMTLASRLTGSPKFDVAVFHLLEPDVVKARWRPVRLVDVVRPADPVSGVYHLAGWPLVRSQKVPGGFKANKYTFTCDHDPTLVDHDPDTSLVLPIDRGAHVNLLGTPSPVPELEGISGCPVWRIFDAGSERFVPRLAAVQTGYVDRGQHRCIMATRWSVVRSLIMRAVPGLIESAEKLLPP